MTDHPIDPATSRYLSQICAAPSLNKAEELALARAYLERGDLRARDRVLQANLRHVVALALRHRALGVPVGDLVAYGSLGLMQALERFEPSRGLRLATYANHWIRAEMLSAALKGRSMVGGGVGALGPRYALRMRREHARLQARLGDSREVLDQLGARYGKTPEQVAEILQRIEQRDASFDGALGSSAGPLGELLGAPVDSPETRADQSRHGGEVAAAVASAGAALSAREQYIVEHRFVADHEERRSLREIGAHIGVSRERARQLEEAVKRKLRARLAPLAARLELDAA